VQSSGTLQKLAMRHLITEVGRKDEPGRPILYGTTVDFLDYFGLKTIKDLPPLPDLDSLDVNDDSEGELFANPFAVEPERK